MKLTCRGCHGERERSKYLCLGCWYQLSNITRSRLYLSDDQAMRRAAELYEMLDRGVALQEIKVSP